MKLLINTISKYLENNFEKRLFEATIQNFQYRQSPLRLNNFAYSMRELFRHILGRLAPTEKVLRCSWYINETNKPNGITRAQRVIYSVKNKGTDTFLRYCGITRYLKGY